MHLHTPKNQQAIPFYCCNLTCEVFGVVPAAVLEAQVGMFPNQKLESRAWSCSSLMSAAEKVASEDVVSAAAALRHDQTSLDHRLQDLSAEELEHLLQDLCSKTCSLVFFNDNIWPP